MNEHENKKHTRCKAVLSAEARTLTLHGDTHQNKRTWFDKKVPGQGGRGGGGEGGKGGRVDGGQNQPITQKRSS